MHHKGAGIIWLYLTVTALVLSAMIGCTSPVETGSTELVSTQPKYFTNTPTETPIAKASPTLPATITPLPTLTTEQALTKIRELFETNGGCQLPCLWGITPGVSAVDPVYNFIQSIAKPDRFWRFSKGLSDNIEFYSGLPEDMQYLGESTLRGRVYSDNGIITQIYVEGFEWPSYHLSPFLLENGKPDEVWIATYGLYDQSSTVPFSVFLLYSEKGMMVAYGGPGKQLEGKIVGCIDRSLSYLVAWIPDKELSFAEAYALVGEFNQNEFKSIADATEGKMDVEQFYEKYKGVEEIPCMETSADLWTIMR